MAIYMWREWGGRTPWVNTLAYYPLAENFNDYSWNNYNLTNAWASITTSGGVDCAYYDGWDWSYYYDGINLTWTYTLSVRWKPSAITSAYQWIAVAWTNYDNQNGDFWWISQTPSGELWASDWFDGTYSAMSGVVVTVNNWYLVTTTVSNYKVCKIYVNGVLKWTADRGTHLLRNQIWITIWGKRWRNTISEKANGYISNVILEDKVRTDQEVADYYNSIKWTYGL